MDTHGDRASWVSHGIVLAVATSIALAAARDHAGGWNDGSRLAMVESLVDRHTLAIDDSIYVKTLSTNDSGPAPYGPNVAVGRTGTLDKLYIDGHYYTDKSPVPGLLMAGFYWALQTGFDLRAATQTDRFAFWMTLLSSGLAYVVSVWSIFSLSEALRLPPRARWLLTASFGLATMAPAYTRHANNHILLLGVTSALTCSLAWLARERDEGTVSWRRWLGIGTLAGLGYTIDLGAGPVLLLCTAALVLYRAGPRWPLAVFAAGMLPWLALHHAVNYSVGGTVGPANAVADYLSWPGSPFNASNMTGGWKHANWGRFLTYSAALLFGKRGFIGHNLPLFLALTGFWMAWRRSLKDRPELLYSAVWAGGTWLMYAVASNNYSGQCCSIRWFLPLLAPGYHILGVLLRERPEAEADLLVLTLWGMPLSGLMAWYGPWIPHMVPLFWPIQGLALASWLALAIRRRQTAAMRELGGTSFANAA